MNPKGGLLKLAKETFRLLKTFFHPESETYSLRPLELNSQFTGLSPDFLF